MPRGALQPLLISQLLIPTRYYRELLHTRKLLLVELVTHEAVAGLTPGREHGSIRCAPAGPRQVPGEAKDRRPSTIHHPLVGRCPSASEMLHNAGNCEMAFEMETRYECVFCHEFYFFSRGEVAETHHTAKEGR